MVNHKERLVTGKVMLGTVKVKIPRTRNRVGGENFHSSLIPRYFKRSLTIDAAVPLLYLKRNINKRYGISIKITFRKFS